jgi:DNA-binding IclR family transcriptional regulator
MREAQILAALAQGPRTVSELAAELYPRLEPGLRPAAAQQILAHLVHLQFGGRVAPDGGRWLRT